MPKDIRDLVVAASPLIGEFTIMQVIPSTTASITSDGSVSYANSTYIQNLGMDSGHFHTLTGRQVSASFMTVIGINSTSLVISNVSTVNICATNASISNLSITGRATSSVITVNNLYSTQIQSNTVQSDTVKSATGYFVQCNASSLNISGILVQNLSVSNVTSYTISTTTINASTLNACQLPNVVSGSFLSLNCNQFTNTFGTFQTSVHQALNSSSVFADNVTVDNRLTTPLIVADLGIFESISVVSSSTAFLGFMHSSFVNVSSLSAGATIMDTLILNGTATFVDDVDIQGTLSGCTVKCAEIDVSASAFVSYLSASKADLYNASVINVTYVSQTDLTTIVPYASIASCSTAYIISPTASFGQCSFTNFNASSANIMTVNTSLSNATRLNCSILNACVLTVQNGVTFGGIVSSNFMFYCQNANISFLRSAGSASLNTVIVQQLISASGINCSYLLSTSLLSVSDTATFTNANVSVLNACSLNVSSILTPNLTGSFVNVSALMSTVANVCQVTTNSVNTSQLTCTEFMNCTGLITSTSVTTSFTSVNVCLVATSASLGYVQVWNLSCNNNACFQNTCAVNVSTRTLTVSVSATVPVLYCSKINNADTSKLDMLASVRSDVQRQLDTLNVAVAQFSNQTITSLSLTNASITTATISSGAAYSLNVSFNNVFSGSMVYGYFNSLTGVTANITKITSTSLISGSLITASTVSTVNCCCQHLSVVSNGSFGSLTVQSITQTLGTCSIANAVVSGNLSATSFNASRSFMNSASMLDVTIGTLRTNGTISTTDSINASSVNGVTDVQFNYLKNINADVQATLDALMNLMIVAEELSSNMSVSTVSAQDISCNNLNVETVGTFRDIQCNGIGRFVNNVISGYSDDRLKTNVVELSECLPIVRNWRTFKYEPDISVFNQYGIPSNLRGMCSPDIGMSAQDVGRDFSELVCVSPFESFVKRTDEEENSRIVVPEHEPFMTIRYDRLGPVIVKCIRELADKIDELNERLNSFVQ